MDRSTAGAHACRNTFETSVELLPNPDFVFPMAAPETPSLSVDAAHSARLRPLQNAAAARRAPAHAQRKSTNALPEFSFNPSGSSSSLAAATTPPLSPPPASPTTPRNLGHRRGGSEFIGGDSRSGGVSLLSSSPPKADGMAPPPSSTLQPGPPPGRRGHAHRRSAAISCHDLSSILQPKDANASGRGGSAPSTPRDSEMSNWPRHTAHKSISHPTLQVTSAEENEPPTDEDSPVRPPSRARVGFSDRVEYIRPLSTISSETESSMSTIRGHSVSNSLSSVISASAPSPPSSRMARPSLNTTFEDNHISRPKTAGAVLDKAVKNKEGFNLDLFGRQRPTTVFNLPSPSSPSPLPSPVIRPTKKRFFNLNHKRAQHSADLLTSNSEPSLISSSSSESPPASPLKDSATETATDGLDVPRSAKEKSKRARKVKSWTNPFGSKKPKSPLARPADISPEVPSSPPSSPPSLPIEELSLDDLSANFDVDNTVTIVTPTTDVFPRPQVQTDFASWQPKHLSVPDSDSRSPIIDLDLALGPFESGRRGRGTGRDFASARKTMHSSGFSGGVFPAHLSHRRTESAPALVPFELRKAASTSAMADVFEEDEEEVAEEAPPVTKPVSDAPEEVEVSLPGLTSTKSEETAENMGEPGDEEESNVGIQVVESDLAEGSAMTWNFHDAGLGINRANKPRPLSIETDPLSPIPRPMDCAEGPGPVEVVEDYEEPRTSSQTRSSDSTITPTHEAGPKELQPPMNLAVPLPKQSLMTPDTVHSSFSPDFRPRQNSFEGQRLGTATSSITDCRTINSFAFGEPGPDVRISTDDVPSLTSSRSTMTGGLQYGGFPMLSPRQPGDRTSSICSATSAMSERRRKRSSIASLSKLVTGSFGGERSKLYIEQRPQSEHMDLNITRRSKEKKTKRLSKLMSFWRSSSFSK